MKILVLNAGSSSQKSCLYEIGSSLPEDPPQPLWQAHADWTVASGQVTLTLSRGKQRVSEESFPAEERATFLKRMLETLWSGPAQVLSGPEEIDLIGHRVVHGGPDYRQPALVTSEMKAAIEEYAAFAPTHNPANLEGIQVSEEVFPQARQFAVFDTGFHRQLPLSAAAYPGPYSWLAEGIRRYGFHGINHHYCLLRAAQLTCRSADALRVITCHLGNGCSLAAISQGRSIETTMGFTPLEGLMMGSRSGSLDPGILLYLLEQKGITHQQLNELLNKQSGLKGISGLSGDMRAILKARAEGDERASLAYEMFVHRLRLGIGAMLAALGGLDVLVFSGGIGENAAEVRASACENLGFLKLALDAQRNEQALSDRDIATSASAVRVLVVAAQEDWMIARECWQQAALLT